MGRWWASLSGTPRACRSGHRGCGQGLWNYSPVACFRTTARSAPDRDRHAGAQRGILAHPGTGSGQADQDARIEVERAIFTFNIAAEETVRGYGEYLPLDWQLSTAGRWGIVRRFPLGPIAGISPFNFPLNLVAHKVAPAMAAGCSMVLKPAPQTPLSALLLAEVVQQAGWPDGGLNVLLLSNEDSELLVTMNASSSSALPEARQLDGGSRTRLGKRKLCSNSAVIPR